MALIGHSFCLFSTGTAIPIARVAFGFRGSSCFKEESSQEILFEIEELERYFLANYIFLIGTLGRPLNMGALRKECPKCPPSETRGFN